MILRKFSDCLIKKEFKNMPVLKGVVDGAIMRLEIP